MPKRKKRRQNSANDACYKAMQHYETALRNLEDADERAALEALDLAEVFLAADAALLLQRLSASALASLLHPTHATGGVQGPLLARPLEHGGNIPPVLPPPTARRMPPR